MEQNNDLLVNALAQLISDETSPETREIKNLILRRIAEETEVKPTRIPAPLNITEIGGYYNLIEQIQTSSLELQEKKLQMQLGLIASALGLPV